MMEINNKTHSRTEFINIDKYIASYANKKNLPMEFYLFSFLTPQLELQLMRTLTQM